MRGVLIVVIAAMAAASLPGCAESLDFDRYQRTTLAPQTPGAAVLFTDLHFSCKAMLPHIGEYFELRVVDKDDAVQAKVVYDRMVAQDFSFVLPTMIPRSNPPYRLDYWSDQNGSTTYSGNKGTVDEKDHGWRRRLEDSLKPEPPPLPPNVVPFLAGKYDIVFIHDTDFTDLFTNPAGKPVSFEDSLLAFDLSIVGAGAHVGKMIEVRVVEPATRRLVGVHRKGKAEATYKLHIGGILDEQTPYEVSIFVDVDGNERYSAGEPSWKSTFTSTAAGIVDEVDLSTAPQSPLFTVEP